MSDSNDTFTQQLTGLWKKGVDLYEHNQHDYDRWFSPQETAFLAEIGVRPREIYDFVEDYVEHGEPSLESFLRIHEIRRDYFLNVQNGMLSDHEVHPDELPPRNAERGGFRWLPRIIAKAKAKLHGELHGDIMYGCGGDRHFLHTHGFRPEDFLKVVRNHEKDEAAIVDWVAKHSRQSG